MKQIHNNQKLIHELRPVEANTGIASMPVLDEITEGKETSTVNLGGMVNHKRHPLKRPTFSNGGSSDDRKPAAKKRKVVAENFNKSENQSAAQNFQGRPKEMRSVVRNLRLTNFELLSEQELRTLGRTVYQLSNEQVLTPNYGAHTLKLLDYLPFDFSPKNIQFTAKLLMDKDEGGTMEKSFNQERFKMVSGLNKFQALGIIEYGLSIAQVGFLRFSKSILKVMGVLRKENPDASGPYLYDAATHLQPYQIHGIVQDNQTLGKLNIALDDNGRFGQFKPVDPRHKGNPYRPGEEGVFGRDLQEANRQSIAMLTRTHLALPFIPVLDAGNQFIGQNSPEQYQETGGDLERGYQEGQESATMPNEIPEPAARAVDSFLALAQSPVALIPPNVARRGDPDLNNTKPNKNHKLKTKQNKP